MLKPESWTHYYATLVRDAYTDSSDRWDAVSRVVALVLAVILTVLSAGQPTGFPRWLAWAFGLAAVALFLEALGRENWRRVKARDEEILRLNRNAGSVYTALCKVCDAVDIVLTVADQATWKSTDGRGEWMARAKNLVENVLPKLYPHLTPLETVQLKNVRFHAGKWYGEADAEHGREVVKLMARRDVLRELAAKYEGAHLWTKP